MHCKKVCVPQIKRTAAPWGRDKSWMKLHNHYMHTCGEVGPMCPLKKRPWVEVCSACPVRQVCKRGHNTRVGWLGLVGAGWASMAAEKKKKKKPSLRWQPEVQCVPEWENKLGDFSLSSNRKPFVAVGTRGWPLLVPCKVACTAKAI